MSLLACALAVASAQAAAKEPARSAETAAALAGVDRGRLEADVRALAGFATRHPRSPVDDPVRGVGAARKFLREQLEAAVADSDGNALLREQAFDHKLGRGSDEVGHFVNFIVEIGAGDPERGVWVIGGHYDSRNRDANDGTRDAPGADDDASGTAVVLELARRLAPIVAERPLPAGILLCAFDGEEHGLYGSDALAEELKQKGIVVEGMVTNDIVGGGSPSAAATLRCFSEPFPEGAEKEPFFRVVGGESDGPSRQLARFADRVAERYLEGDLDVRLVLRRDRFGRGGDHESFNQRGFPAIRFTEPVEDYAHQHEDVRDEGGVRYGDRVEFVDFAQLARVARLNLAVALEGAGAPPPPARVHLEGAVKPHATVTWVPAPESTTTAVAGYRVFARATGESTWPAAGLIFVPAGATSFEDPARSVDDWQFGVATVGTDGRESPVRFPTAKPRPARRSEGGK